MNKNTLEKENELNRRTGRMELLIRVGKVCAVDVKAGKVRVIYPEKDGMTSPWLTVLRQVPLVTVEKWTDDEKWDMTAQYGTYDRQLGIGEEYRKSYPDEIENTITLEYNCPEHGAEDVKVHRERVTVRPWMPYIDQMVLCLYMPYGKTHEGYVLGAITP